VGEIAGGVLKRSEMKQQTNAKISNTRNLGQEVITFNYVPEHFGSCDDRLSDNQSRKSWGIPLSLSGWTRRNRGWQVGVHQMAGALEFGKRRPNFGGRFSASE